MPNRQELYQQIGQLPSLEKLQLAEQVFADMDVPNPEIYAIWREEARKRWQAYKKVTIPDNLYAPLEDLKDYM